MKKKLIVTDQFLTIGHYKEPLMPVENGYGYLGALCITKDGSKLQCHICGSLFADVGSHIRQSHKVSLDEYREVYQLARGTSLISETERLRRKEHGQRLNANLTPEQRKEKSRTGNRIRNKNGYYQPKNRLETENMRGTCPQQLIEKIREVAKDLGHTPSLSEFITETGGQRFKHLIFKVYGSWKEALKVAELTPTEPAKGGYRKYTNEELLEYLSIYAQEYGKIPTATDSKRKLIPDYYAYIRRFGSFEEARQQAGVYQIVDRLN